MKQEIRLAEEFELRKLNDAQEFLIKSETQKLVNARYLFEQAERKRAEEEQKEFEDRNKWRDRVPEVDETSFSSKLSPKTPLKQQDFLHVLSETSHYTDSKNTKAKLTTRKT
jgi:hypothetical protein